MHNFRRYDPYDASIDREAILSSQKDTKDALQERKYIIKLKGNEPGPDENLEIELGLDSLDQVELITYVENSFSIKLNETIFTTHSTLRSLSEYISEKSSSFNEMEVKMNDIIKNAPYAEVKKGYLQWLLFPITWLLFKIYFRFEIINKQKIEDKPTVFIANHESFVDALILSLALPLKVHNKTFYLALEKYFSNKFMRYIAKNGNIISLNIEKDVRKSVEKISNVLKQGNNVFIFPEGTRTKDGKLSSFKKVFAIIAKELNVNIQCIGIDGAYEAYSRFSIFPKPKKITMEILEKIDPQNMTYDEIVEKSYNIFLEYKKRMKPKVYLDE